MDLRLCQQKANGLKKVVQRVRPETVERLLMVEREAEERGFQRGREASRAMVLKWGIKHDSFPHSNNERPHYRCQECAVSWSGARDAHPPSEGCAVQQALARVDVRS